MKWKKKASHFLLARTKFWALLFVLLSAETISAQEFHFEFNSLTAIEILGQIEEASDVIFNYDHSIFSESKEYSFGVSGPIETVFSICFSQFDKHYAELEDKLYVIQNRPLDKEKRMDESHYRLKLVDEYGGGMASCFYDIGRLGISGVEDVNGQLDISGYFAEDTELLISYIAYADRTIKMSELKSDELNVLVMQSSQHQLGEVVIMDHRIAQDISAIDQAYVLNPDKFIAAGTADNDGLVLSQMIPGVYNSSESLKDLQIRGGPPDQTHLLWNNIQIFQTSLFYGKVSSVNPFLTQQIKVNKNGASASTNNSSAGSIMMDSDMAATKGFGMKFQSDLLYYNIGTGFSLWKDKIRVQAAFRQSYSQLFKSNFYQKLFDNSFQFGAISDDVFYAKAYEIEEFYEYDRDFGFKDFSASLEFKPSERFDWKFSYMSVQNELNYRQTFEYADTTNADDFRISNVGIGSEMNFHWSPKMRTQLDISHSDYRYFYERLLFADGKELDVVKFQDNRVGQSKIGLSHHIEGKTHCLSIGVERAMYDVMLLDVSYQGEEPEFFVNHDISSHELSMFADYRLRWKSLELKSGVKWSDYSLTFDDRKFIEPRFHLSYLLGDDWTVHGHRGKYHQVLNRRNILTALQADDGFWYASDEGRVTDNWIMVVNTELRSVGLRFQKNQWRVDLEGYRKSIEFLWTSALDLTYEEDPYQFVDSEVSGLEFLGNYQKNNFSLSTSINLMKDQFALLDGRKVNSPFYQPWRLGAFANYKLGSFDFSLAWNFAKGRYYSLPDSFEERENEEGKKYFVTVFTELLTEQGIDYHRLDLTTNYHVQLRKKIDTRISLSLLNIYARENITRNQFLTDYRQNPVETGFFQRKGLPFTPNISVYFEW